MRLGNVLVQNLKIFTFARVKRHLSLQTSMVDRKDSWRNLIREHLDLRTQVRRGYIEEWKKEDGFIPPPAPECQGPRINLVRRIEHCVFFGAMKLYHSMIKILLEVLRRKSD